MKFLSKEDICKMEHEFIANLELLDTVDDVRRMSQMMMYIAGASHFAKAIIAHIEEGEKNDRCKSVFTTNQTV